MFYAFDVLILGYFVVDGVYLIREPEFVLMFSKLFIGRPLGLTQPSIKWVLMAISPGGA
jgi:hypothetical protein